MHHPSVMSVTYLLLIAVVVATADAAEAANADDQAAQRGYRLLTEQALLPSDFSSEAFDQVWRSWPEPLRGRAAEATPDRRRAMAFRRYGLTPRPGDDSGKPLQYVVDDATGRWTMNCFACHGGSVYGKIVPGAPNNRYALQTLTEEIRRTKLRTGEKLTRMDLGALVIPLGTTRGTTNAVVFGQGLMQRRDQDLNVVPAVPGDLTHHDLDAPPWWHFHKRPYLYIDGFAPKGHRALMQFMLVPTNGPEFFRRRERDFRDVYAYLSSLRAPKYDGPVDAALAEQGRAVFESTCAECHGTYGADERYPNRAVPIDEIGTDPVRFESLTVANRQQYAESWFARGDSQDARTTITDPVGYVAPPLDGVWASPPYLHNGSVPTLWHLLHPDERPAVWRRTGEAIDHQRIGFQIETVDQVPQEPDIAKRRDYFDTRRFGKSNRGHRFPELLSEAEKRAVLEYLKTL